MMSEKSEVQSTRTTTEKTKQSCKGCNTVDRLVRSWTELVKACRHLIYALTALLSVVSRQTLTEQED